MQTETHYNPIKEFAEFFKRNPKAVYILVTFILIAIIGIKLDTIQTPDRLDPDTQVLVEKQQTNLEIIANELEIQRKLRSQMAVLNVALEASVLRVEEAETANLNIRSKLLENANHVSLNQ